MSVHPPARQTSLLPHSQATIDRGNDEGTGAMVGAAEDAVAEDGSRHLTFLNGRFFPIL